MRGSTHSLCCFFLGSIILLAAAPVVAESPRNIAVSARIFGTVSADTNIRVDLRTKEGRRQLILSPRASFRPGGAKLYQGYVKPRSREVRPLRVAGDYTKGLLTLRFEGKESRSHRRRMWITRIRSGSDNQEAEVLSTSHSVKSSLDHQCGEVAQPRAAVIDSGSPVRASRTAPSIAARIIDISLDADAEFATQFGTATPAAMEGILNAVESIYLQQLGLAFNLVSSHHFSDSSQPYTSSSPIGLLTQFSDYTNNSGHLGDADIYHLLTGKRFFSPSDPTIEVPVVGLAFKGTACRLDGQASYGFSRLYNEASLPLTVAHEIAHNLNATHDMSNGSLMAPIAPPANPHFSAASHEEIHEYIATYGSCLATEQRDVTVEAEEALPTVSLTTKLGKSRILRLEASLDENIDGECYVELFASRRQSALKIDTLESSRKIASIPLDDESVSLRSRISQTLRKALFLRAQVQCDGLSVTTTEILRVGPSGRQAALRAAANRRG